MLLSLVNCAIVRTAQLTSESNILFISSCSAELKEIVTPVGSFQFVRRRSLLHSQQLVQTLSCCWHFPLWSVWILHVSGCVFCDIKNVNNSTLFWQAQCRQIRKVTSRAQKFSWNKEVWGEKKKNISGSSDGQHAHQGHHSVYQSALSQCKWTQQHTIQTL